MEEQLNLIQKLARIRAIADVAQKDRKGYNYTYADITSILANVTAGMKKYGVSLIPSIVPGTAKVTQNVVRNTKVAKNGTPFENVVTEMLVSADMRYTWVNDDNPEDILVVPWFMVGSQGDPSQAGGSALTYFSRYFLINFFQIATTDNDVDAYRSKQKEAEVSEGRAIAVEIIETFDTTLRKFLADNPDRKDEVAKFLSRYAKNSNYKAIKEPTLAAKLVADFKSRYLKEE